MRAIDKELGAKFHVLHGVELNMGTDGSLDYDDEVLKGFDWCVASLHSNFKMSRRDQTKRFLRAIENPYVHVVGHPSGRRLDRREGVDFDWKRSRKLRRSTTSRSRSTRIRAGSTCVTSTSGSRASTA